MKLKTLLHRIALQSKAELPFLNDIEGYVEDFIPNILLKSETLQQAFGVTNYEMEKLYEEAYAYYEVDRYLDSSTVFRWLILFNSYETKYWMGLAANQQLLDRYEKALHAYAIAALLDCENPFPHYYAYECYTLMQNKEDAEKALAMAYTRCEGKTAFADLKEKIKQLKEVSCHPKYK